MADGNAGNKPVEYRQTEKFDAWVKAFYDKTNPKTYRNKTQSAIYAYNLDPVEDYVTAGSMGYQNFKKLQFLASDYLDAQGFTFDQWINLAVKNAMESKMPSWWLIVADLAGLYTKKPDVLIQNNTQINTVVQMQAKEIETAKADFDEFLENKYRDSVVVDATSG